MFVAARNMVSPDHDLPMQKMFSAAGIQTIGMNRGGTQVITSRHFDMLEPEVEVTTPWVLAETVLIPAVGSMALNKRLDTAGVLLPLMLPLMLLQVPCHSWAELGHSTCHHRWEQ